MLLLARPPYDNVPPIPRSFLYVSCLLLSRVVMKRSLLLLLYIHLILVSEVLYRCVLLSLLLCATEIRRSERRSVMGLRTAVRMDFMYFTTQDWRW